MHTEAFTACTTQRGAKTETAKLKSVTLTNRGKAPKLHKVRDLNEIKENITIFSLRRCFEAKKANPNSKLNQLQVSKKRKITQPGNSKTGLADRVGSSGD